MGKGSRALGVFAGLAAVSCGGAAVDYPSVDGDYWWYLTRLYFTDGDPPAPFTLEGDVRLVTEQGRLFLETPDCPRTALRRSGARGEVLTGGPQSCELSPGQIAVGQTSRTVVALRIDLERRAMHRRFCVESTFESTFHPGCATEDAVFVPWEDVSDGLGGGGAGADAPLVTSKNTNSAVLWAYTEHAATMWTCDQLDEAVPECVSGPGLMNRRIDGVTGTVQQLKDGRFYLSGFDCLAPAGYEGERLHCGESFAGLQPIAAPEIWVTRLIVLDDHLSFQAEVTDSSYRYDVRLEAPLTRL